MGAAQHGGEEIGGVQAVALAAEPRAGGVVLAGVGQAAVGVVAEDGALARSRF